MKVKAKLPEFDAVQYDGTNRDECDRFAGEKSRESDGNLFYTSVVGDHLLMKGDYLVSDNDQVEAVPAAEFATRFETVTPP